MSQAATRAPVRHRIPYALAAPPDRAGSLGLAALGLIVAVAAFVRFWGLTRQSFWYDETMTAWLLRGTPGQTLAAVPHSEATPPLYYMLAWPWVRVFGDHEAGLRSLSAVAGTLTVPVTFLAGRALAGMRVGLVAAALIAVNPFMVWYSQEGRSYALLALFASLSFYLFARAKSEPTRGRLLAWALVSAVALCTHYFAIFVVAPAALLLLLDRRAELRWRIVAIGVVGVVELAMLAIATGQNARTKFWMFLIPLPVRLRQIVEEFTVGFRPPARLLAVGVAGLALLAALVLLFVRGDARERRGAALAAFVGAAAVGVPVLAAAVGVDYLNTRNIIAALVPIAVVAAAGFGARRAGLLGLGAAAVLVAVSLTMIVELRGDRLAQRPPWRQVAAAIGPAHGSRAILLNGSGTWSRPLGFYLPDTWYMPRKGAAVAEIDVVRRIPVKPVCHDTWWGATCDVGARPALKHPPAPGFRLVSTQRVYGFEVARYRAARPVHLYRYPPYADAGAQARYSSGHAPRRHLLLTPTPSPVVP